MNKLLAQVLGAAAFLALGYAIGRMTLEKAPQRPVGANVAMGTSASSSAQPKATAQDPQRPTVPVTTHPAAQPPHVAKGHEHEHEHDIPKPHPGPIPDDISGDLRDLLTTLHESVKGGDPDALTAAQKKLTAYIGDSTDRALEVVAWFKREEDPQSLDILASCVAENQRISVDPQVISAFLGVAQKDSSENRRMEALMYLGQRPSLGEDTQRQILALAQGDADQTVRVNALVALGQQATNDSAAAQRLDPELLSLAGREIDPQCRAQALQALNMREVSGDQVRVLATFLGQDQDTSVRLTAAERLGEVAPQARPMALQSLHDDFVRDADEAVRRTCMLSIVKDARGEEGVAALRGIRSVDPRLTQDIDDYISILGSGVWEQDDIWKEKARLEQARAPRNTFPEGDEK